MADDAYYWDAAFWALHRNIFADPYVENCDTLEPRRGGEPAEFAEMLWKFAREEFGYEAVNSGTIDSGPFTDMDEGDPGVSFNTRRSMLGWAYPNGILLRHQRHHHVPRRPGDPRPGGPPCSCAMTRCSTAARPPSRRLRTTPSAWSPPTPPWRRGSPSSPTPNTTPYSAREGLTFTFTSSDSNVASVVKYSGTSFSCRITACTGHRHHYGPGTSNGLTASLTVTVTGDPAQQVPETPTEGLCPGG